MLDPRSPEKNDRIVFTDLMLTPLRRGAEEGDRIDDERYAMSWSEATASSERIPAVRGSWVTADELAVDGKGG